MICRMDDSAQLEEKFVLNVGITPIGTDHDASAPWFFVVYRKPLAERVAQKDTVDNEEKKNSLCL